MTVVAAAIPIFNEADTIGQIVSAVGRRVDIVVVVDDGSVDGGAEIAQDAGAELIRHRQNRGKGHALAAAIKWARDRPDVEWLVLLDGDGQHDPDEVSGIVASARRQQCDIMIGSRFAGSNNAALYRVVGLHTLSAAAYLGSGIFVSDSQSGFRVLSRRAVDALRLREGGFAVEAEMQFQASKGSLVVSESPIGIRYSGPARRSPVLHGVSVLVRTVFLTWRYRPWRVFLFVLMPFALWRVVRSHSADDGETAGD